MKHILFLLSVALYLLPVTVQAQCHPAYRLVWQDDFNETSIDTTAWSIIPRGKADWNRHMSSSPDCYSVTNGNLVLRGINNTSCPADTARFLTGGLFTKGKRTIRYGKVEVCARLQGAQGAWPAIWMLADQGGWPETGEIDIMERLNHDTIAYQTVHTYYSYILKHDQEPPHGATGPIRPDGYNVYSVEVLPDSLVFAINGRRTFAYPRIQTTEPGQYPFGIPLYLLIDMQVEGSWVGKADPAQLPVEMWVDWVRMYELAAPRAARCGGCAAH